MDSSQTSFEQLSILPRSFYEAPAVEVAPSLLGMLLVRADGDGVLAGRIVETEAYHQSDPASHSYTGPTARTESMFGPAGHAYVYFIYGMHYCFNVVCEAEGIGSAVLIRAVEPLVGVESMKTRRAAARKRTDLTNGPAKLAQAFEITRNKDNGKDLTSSDLRICTDDSRRIEADRIVRATRVGITKATDKEWRYYLRGCPFVSRL